jgi:hypothetical protein
MDTADSDSDNDEIKPVIEDLGSIQKLSTDAN